MLPHYNRLLTINNDSDYMFASSHDVIFTYKDNSKNILTQYSRQKDLKYTTEMGILQFTVRIFNNTPISELMDMIQNLKSVTIQIHNKKGEIKESITLYLEDDYFIDYTYIEKCPFKDNYTIFEYTMKYKDFESEYNGE